MMYRILYVLVYLLSCIPRPIGLWLGEFTGKALYWILRRRREVALNNLVIAFGGQIGIKKRREIAKKSFQFMGRHFFEVCYLIRFSKKKLASYIKFKGVNHFEQAKAQNKGIIFLTGHFGCWELMAASFGYFFSPAYLVTKPLDFPPAEKLAQILRGVSGNQCVTKEKSMRRLIQILNQGAFLAILLDQNIDWYDGVFVPFFNKRACTNKGLALLVRKTLAPVVPVFITHQGRGHYLIEFKPVLPWMSFGDRTKEIEENTALYNQVIEDTARQYPEQYFWVHQRWKTRPYQPWPRKEG